MGIRDRDSGNSSHTRYSRRIFLARSKRKPPPWITGLDSPHRLISFFELLGAYIGVRLWTPSLLCNNDLVWSAIPIVTDNIGDDFILRKHYAADSPASWMLRELAPHSLTNNTTIVSKHTKGDSGKLDIWADKISRNSYIPIDGGN